MRHDVALGPDPLTSASTTVAIVVALNKPVYPLYVWYLAPDAFKASLVTTISMVFYAALPFIARRSGLAARAGLVAIGTLDTLIIDVFMGGATGAFLFFPACLMLAAVLFHDEEVWISRALIAVVFCLSAGALFWAPYPVVPVSRQDAATLFSLNATGALALMAFIGLRLPRLSL